MEEWGYDFDGDGYADWGQDYSTYDYDGDGYAGISGYDFDGDGYADSADPYYTPYEQSVGYSSYDSSMIEPSYDAGSASLISSNDMSSVL